MPDLPPGQPAAKGAFSPTATPLGGRDETSAKTGKRGHEQSAGKQSETASSTEGWRHIRPTNSPSERGRWGNRTQKGPALGNPYQATRGPRPGLHTWFFQSMNAPAKGQWSLILKQGEFYKVRRKVGGVSEAAAGGGESTHLTGQWVKARGPQAHEVAEEPWGAGTGCRCQGRGTEAV